MQRHYHFIGIGGIGMSGIAQLLLSRGVSVSGSDVKETEITRTLRGLGATIFIGHTASNIEGADAVVYSSAIKNDNPEMQAAKKKGVRLIRRAQALAHLMKHETVITVTGSHGKTTTTSLVSYMLLEAGLSPTAAIGGILKNIDRNACIGEGKFFVAEADESDGSFLYYKPKYSIITNIDHEHLDYYGTFENEVRTFKEFIHGTDPGGCVFCCGDDVNLRDILKDYRNRFVLFGMTEESQIYPKDIQLKGLSSEFSCFYENKLLDRFYLSLGGQHNISNALAVIALGLELDIDIAVIKKALESYQGAHRRIEVKFESKDCRIIDDYAHHPTEIQATLKTVKELGAKRVIAIFQPHRYTRTQLLLHEFAQSFDNADYVIITDIYPASESPIEGINARLLYEKLKEHSPSKEIRYLAKDEILKHLLEIMRPQDLIITLGAGDIVKVCDELVERLKRQG